jgi:hypothetical protein
MGQTWYSLSPSTRMAGRCWITSRRSL